MEGGLIVAALLFIGVPVLLFLIGVVVAFVSKRMPVIAFLGLGFVLGLMFCLVLNDVGGRLDAPTLGLLVGAPVVLYWGLIVIGLVRRKSA